MASPRSPSAESAESFESGECDVSQYRCAIRYRTHKTFSPVCEDNPPPAVSAGCAVNALRSTTTGAPPAASAEGRGGEAAPANVTPTQSAVTAENKKRVIVEPGPSAALAEAAGDTAKKQKTDAS